MKKSILYITMLLSITACTSTKSTLQNTDDNAPDLLLSANNTFVIQQYSTDKKYGYDKDYPVNIFFIISGFLITKLLILEEIKNGKINLSGLIFS